MPHLAADKKEASMIRIKELTTYLEEIAPLSLQESYDNSGLIVGDPETEITGVLVCLDSIEAVIDEAIKNKCNLVIAHHPIIFGGLKKLNGKNYIERTVIKAIRNNIAIYAIHTNLDNVSEGVNRKIGKKLGLENLAILSGKKGTLSKLVTFAPHSHANVVRTALFAAGAGAIGNYDECSFNTEGTGTFRGNESSQPFAGKKGERHEEKEIRIESIFESHKERAVLAALRKSHPYEEIAYDILALQNGHSGIGSGMIGELKSELAEKEFIQQLKVSMKASIVRHSPALGKSIRKVAICGGSGSFLLENAVRSGADALVTADFRYHQFFGRWTDSDRRYRPFRERTVYN